MNIKYSYNNGWQFKKSVIDARHIPKSSEGYTPVQIPHDWLIEDTQNLYEEGIGWYRNQYSYSGHGRVFMRFEGVYMDSTLYINGIKVGEWKYGYSTFEFEITEALNIGDNQVDMRVVYQAPNSRWYSGAGIYRQVWMIERESTFLISDGTYTTIRKVDENAWTLDVATEVEGLDQEQGLSVDYKLLDYSTRECVGEYKGTLSSEGVSLVEQVSGVKTWDDETPHCYQLVVELKQEGVLIDTDAYIIGFREIRMDSETGFWINGVNKKLNGTCEHHDLGALGAAVYTEAIRKRLLHLKEMGVNAIRTSHNMPAVELMELADICGLYVVSEGFDMWERTKTTYDYGNYFKEWSHTDVGSWVRRDRNHPSLIMWSIGNEIYDTHVDEHGQDITRYLVDYVREFDPKENAPITIGSNYMPWENARKCADIVKYAGYNYSERYYEAHHAQHPDWIIYGSETSSTVQSRGIYHFPHSQPILADEDLQCSSLGNSQTSWGAKSTEACITDDRDAAFSLGQFIWTGYDYIGEPTPYQTKNSYFGQIDTAGFEKDSFYIYQSAWTDYKKAPMVHIFPYWDFNPGQIVDVRVCTNAPSVELFFNHQLIGRKTFNHRRDTDIVGTWQIPYEEGCIIAIAYDEEGNEVARQTRYSFGDSHGIKLEPNKTSLIADSRDLVYVTISTTDKNGHPVENAVDRVYVSVTGAGRLLGLDNGDSSDPDQYVGMSRRLFSGKLCAIIGATKDEGPIHMTVSGEGLDVATCTLQALQGEYEERLTPKGTLTKDSIYSEAQPREILLGRAKELPLRKIEIRPTQPLVFTPECQSIEVEALCYPSECSYTDIEWKLVNDAGIESPLGAIEYITDHKIRLTAKGDGVFRLRAMSKNGGEHIRLISQMECVAEGIGIAYKNPYQEIVGGLYDEAEGDVTNGNEKGFATGRAEKTEVGFKGIDFGKSGAEEVTLPIFALDSNPYPFQIWEGKPKEAGSICILDAVYQKPSQWNVYQEECYKLDKVLTGITDIWFVFYDKVHVKGMVFTERQRAYSYLKATQRDAIYGDAFVPAEDAIMGIGNNVSITYTDLDFGDVGTNQILIEGRSDLDLNTIHIRFSGENGDLNQLVEFEKAGEWTSRTFTIDALKGKGDLTFIFLPGSNFDFKGFRFMQA